MRRMPAPWSHTRLPSTAPPPSGVRMSSRAEASGSSASQRPRNCVPCTCTPRRSRSSASRAVMPRGAPPSRPAWRSHRAEPSGARTPERRPSALAASSVDARVELEGECGLSATWCLRRLRYRKARKRWLKMSRKSAVAWSRRCRRSSSISVTGIGSGPPLPPSESAGVVSEKGSPVGASVSTSRTSLASKASETKACSRTASRSRGPCERPTGTASGAARSSRLMAWNRLKSCGRALSSSITARPAGPSSAPIACALRRRRAPPGARRSSPRCTWRRTARARPTS